MATEFTEQELASMTPAEREAVTAEDDDSDMQSNFGYDDDVTDVVPKEAPAAPKEDPAGLFEDDGAAPKAAYVAADVENYDEKVTALETKKDEAFKQMMDGELADSEYRTIEKEVSSELRKLDRDQAKAEISADMTQQQARGAWGDYVEQQIAANKAAGADLSATDALMAELDRTTRLIAAQVSQDPSMVKHLLPTKAGALITNVDKWVLNEAIEIVKTRNNLLAKTPIDDARRKPGPPDLSKIPPSLAKVPPAADPVIGADEFSHLNGLKGVDYERALARMTPDQLERFMG
jgi:hypothetical protein